MKQWILIISIIATMTIAVGVMIFPADHIMDEQQQISTYAQPINNTNTTTTEIITTTKNIHNATFPGQTIVHRGIISSEEPAHLVLQPGEKNHGVEILPHRPDEATYTGILTFTATKPVEVGFGHRLHLDNSTISQLDTETFGEFHMRHHVKSQQHITPGIISVPSVIVPDYGSTPPYFSASIPFVGSSVYLKTTNGEPFIAVYEVVAEVVQPQAHVVDVESAPVGNMSGMNMSGNLSQNTTTAENMTQQQQGGGASNGQTNATDTTIGGGNMTNQSQQRQQEQQGQNNENPLSNIPILGELFGR
jgi:hypothetical protein